VKLLAVLHISSALGRLVDLSVEIVTGRRRMIDIISTPGRLAVVQYGAKTPYSLDITLITTQLSVDANRCVVNRFQRPLSECPLNPSWCVAPGRWRLHDLTYHWLSVNF